MNRLFAILLLLAVFSLFTNCKKLNTMNGKYEWLTLTTADEGYPMKIRSGEFYNQNGESIAGIPADMYLSSQWWDGDSGVMITGDQYRDIPARMKIKWYSYAEDQFYEGDFKINNEKISNLFKEGTSCEKGNYKYINVAIAPAGQVYLYLTGPNSTLIGAFQAKEYFVDNFVKEMRITKEGITREISVKSRIEDMPLQTQQEIAEKRISTQIWKDINIHYPWNYTHEVEDDQRPLIMQKDKLGADYINGETSWCVSPDYFQNTNSKAIPLEIDAKFETQAGMKLVIRIYPGNVNGVEAYKQPYAIRRAREQELVKVFKDFYEKIGKQPFSIHLKINDDFKTGKVYLKKVNVEQEIPNVEVQIFNTTFDN